MDVRKRWGAGGCIVVAMMAAALAVDGAHAQTSAPGEAGTVWQVPEANTPAPHLQEVNGHQVLYVDGQPFTALASEIPWWDLIAGRYRETEGVYDALYPAAAQVGLNSLKVPVKWSQVEPKKDEYDFSYIDHAKAMAEKNHLKLILDWFGHYASNDGTIYANLSNEAYVPFYIIEDEKTYPRAVDADGVVHHNAISYEYDAVIQREIKAFRAFMDHIKQVDAHDHTIIMIQVENEIAVFGADRQNRKLWRDHTPAADKHFQQSGITDELKYSAWQFSKYWIDPLTEAGAAVYPLPFLHNFVGGKLEDAIVGGAPGEDVSTYLENCPKISFIGLNMYLAPEATPDEIRKALARYKVGRNLPSLTETNSGNDLVAPRAAYIAVGEFGAPIFAPWALDSSYPAAYSPYVTEDGTVTTFAGPLRDTYRSLEKATAQIAKYAGSDKLKVLMATAPGQKYDQTADVNGLTLTASGEGDSKVMVIHPGGHDLLLIGYHASVVVKNAHLVWPALKTLKVSKGHFDGSRWEAEGEPLYQVNQSADSLEVDLDTPQAVRISW